MSPIPSVPTVFALSPATSSVALDPGSAGQLTTATSQHPLGTGGFVFTVVAIVSMAGYFYHGRGTSNNTRTSNTWASLTRFFSSMRHRGSAATSKTTVTDWPVDLEQHVDMVYARCFHPTFWNLVECHPATASAPAIYVEYEAEMPVPEPKPFGMNSFLDMDNDICGDREDDPGDTHENEDAEQGPRSREQVAPYDTNSGMNINFSSEVIGTTVRQGIFLCIPDEHEDDSTETSSTDSESDFASSPYDGILTMPLRPSDSELDLTCSTYGILTTPPTLSDGLFETSSELDSTSSHYDGIFMTPPRSPHDLSVASSDGLGFICSPYDGFMIAPLRLSPCKRRYGMADMADLAQTLKDTIPEEGYPLVPTISRRTGLCDVSEFARTHSAMARTSPDRCNPVDEQTISSRNIGDHDSHDGLRNGSTDTDVFVAPHEGLDLMRRLLEGLRDPNMDCTPRVLSEDNDSECGDSEYSTDGEERRSIPRRTPTWSFDGMRRTSLESASTTPRTDSDVSDEGPIYPFTPPPRPATSDVQKARMASEVTFGFNEEWKLASPTSSHSPPSLLSKVYVRTHRDNRSFLYGPWSPLVVLPRL